MEALIKCAMKIKEVEEKRLLCKNILMKGELYIRLYMGANM